MRPFRFLAFVLGMVPMLCLGSGVRAEARDVAEQPQSAVVAPPAAVLQVSEKAGLVSISADHADVQSALKLLFDQTERQFVTDGSVSGQVTLRLTGQPLPVVLNAVCAQTFLRYQIDPNGIYHFERNIEAVRAAFTQLRLLNGLLRQQLRVMGLEVPADAALDATPLNQAGARGMPQNGYPAQGGFGGAGRFGYADPNMRNAPGLNLQTSEATRKADIQQKLNARFRAAQGNATSPQNQQTPPTDNAPTLKMQAPVNGSAADYLAYQQAVAQNNFVSFNIPFGKPLPVTALLTQLSRQANVPILIDPDVPSGSVFRIDGKMTPRPLPEALNILARQARLEWRWVGDKIFVTTTPDFQIYYGDSTVPRAGTLTKQQLQKASAGPAGPAGASKAAAQKPKPAPDK